MTSRPIRDEFQEKSKWSRRGASELLLRHGTAFDRLLRREVARTYKACSSEPWFVPAAIQALVWSKHATLKSDDHWGHYVDECRRAFADPSHDPQPVLRHAGRYGPESLSRSLEGFRTLYFERQDLFEEPVASPKALRANQEWLIGMVMGRSGPGGLGDRLSGIGPWLGFAPHKIQLIWQESWWEESATDSVYQPLGSVVSHGLRMLAKAGVIKEADAAELRAEGDGNDSADGFATVALAQDIQARLAAELPGGRVMHINSALYELGFRGN